jgi:hypothetical protein
MNTQAVTELGWLEKILESVQDRLLILAKGEVEKENHSLVTFSELDSLHVVVDDVQKRISAIVDQEASRKEPLIEGIPSDARIIQLLKMLKHAVDKGPLTIKCNDFFHRELRAVLAANENVTAINIEALKDLESFCVSRKEMIPNEEGKGAYKDVLFLVRQHLKIAEYRKNLNVDPL